MAGASWLSVNGSILVSKVEQGNASEPSVSRDSGRSRGGERRRVQKREECKRESGERSYKTEMQIRRLRKVENVQKRGFSQR